MQKSRVWWIMLLPGLLFMTLLFVLPLLILIRYSFYQFTPGQLMKPAWVLKSYSEFFTNSFYSTILLRSLWLGIKVVFFSALLGYPVAYLLARRTFRIKRLASAIVIIPLLTSGVVTTFGWIVILSDTGLVNTVLLRLHIISTPIKLIFNETGVIVALVQDLLPFMILSVRSALSGQDQRLEEAALTLGSPPLSTFLRVTLPLSLPGVFSGSLLVFVGTISAFVTPILLGGGRVQTLASTIYTETMVTLNWPFAAASSIILLFVTAILLFGYKRLMESRFLGGGGRT